MRRLTTSACLTIVLALGACGDVDGSRGDPDGAGTADDGRLVCGDASFEEGELATMPALDTLPDEVLVAVDDLGEPAVDDSLDWRVGSARDDEVVLIREFDPDEPAAASGDTHGTMRLGPITGAPDIPDGTWFVWGSGSCSPRLADAAGDDQAELRLADTPSPDDTKLDLLVMERRCASGQGADGRIDLDELTLAEDEVRVRVSVRPPPGTSQECPGNPWTPFTVDLGEPLGDRTVVDGNLVPPRELVVGTGQHSFDPEAEDRDDAVERALSFEVWPDYTLRGETTCFCPFGTYEVVVREGEVVSRRFLDKPELSPDVEPDSSLAPSIDEVLDRLRIAYEDDPDSITDIAVDESGMLIRVAFDPIRHAIDDEIAYRFEVDVDSPGDPVPEDSTAAASVPVPAECPTESEFGEDTGGSFGFFASVEELVLASDVIVVGTVTTVTCGDAGDGRRDRHARIEVEDTLHGEQLAQLEVVSPGDDRGGPITVDGVPPPMLGEAAVWFLRRSVTGTGTFEEVGPQGRYRIDGPDLTPVTHDTDPRVHQATMQIAALGRAGLEQAVVAASQAVASRQLTDEWTNPSGAAVGTSVRMTRGPVHCGWQDMRFLYVEDDTVPPHDRGHLRTYVASPTPGYGVEGWDPDVELPDSAIDTGWRRGSVELWLVEADGSGAAYLVDGSSVERLPLDDTGQGCD